MAGGNDGRERADGMLAQACMAGDADLARQALAAGADPDSPDAWSLGGGWPIMGERPRPLHMAFRRGDGAMSKLLIESGASIELPSLDGRGAASWLGMGLDECAPLWIEAGGDPWRRDEALSNPDWGCLAMVATRGGGAALWRLIAQRPAPGWVAAGLSSKKRGSLESVAKQAMRAGNEPALRVIASMGWRPTAADVVACFEYWEAGRWWESRGFKQAVRLRALGGPAPEASDVEHVAYCHGPSSAARMLREIEERFAKFDAQQIAKSARRSKPSANVARAKPRL